MKRFLYMLFFLPAADPLAAQTNIADSLRNIFQGAKDDSVLYRSAIQLYDFYEEVNRDSAFLYADRCVQITRSNNKQINEAHALTRKAYQQVNLGRFAESLQSLLLSFSICEAADEKAYWNVGTLAPEKNKRLYALICAHHIYGILMRETLNREQATVHFKEAKRIAVANGSYARSLLASLNLGRIYLEAGNFDSALYHQNEALAIIDSSKWQKYLSTILYYSGKAHMSKGDTLKAVQAFRRSTGSAIEQNNKDALTRIYHSLAIYHMACQQNDSAIYYAANSVEVMKKLGFVTQLEYHLGDAYEGLYDAYRSKGQQDSAYKYLSLAQSADDSIYQLRIRSLAEFQKLTLDEQQRSQNIEKEQVAYQNKTRTYILSAGIGLLLLLTGIFLRNNRQKQKAKIKIEKAYQELQATQQQLIQSEKMASLGELTAGIAHEIQNPLNFVNNFSEVNNELAGELKKELATGNLQLATELADDIRNNSEKINHHGKRADAIVKGMLQHSQTSSGQKEPTDINALADEYLRLAYHGLRARDSSFNAKIETNFDPRLSADEAGIGKINIVPQDIGRVILNLVNNAFYAVSEKKKNASAGSAPNGYEPTVSITTKKENGKIILRVTDNGDGIDHKNVEKIFQPFFTTKPTGQGTGLGLSLSYDIVKAHGGDISVSTKQNEGSTFTIQFPASV